MSRRHCLCVCSLRIPFHCRECDCRRADPAENGLPGVWRRLGGKSTLRLPPPCPAPPLLSWSLGGPGLRGWSHLTQPNLRVGSTPSGQHHLSLPPPSLQGLGTQSQQWPPPEISKENDSSPLASPGFQGLLPGCQDHREAFGEGPVTIEWWYCGCPLPAVLNPRESSLSLCWPILCVAGDGLCSSHALVLLLLRDILSPFAGVAFLVVQSASRRLTCVSLQPQLGFFVILARPPPPLGFGLPSEAASDWGCCPSWGSTGPLACAFHLQGSFQSCVESQIWRVPGLNS